jgi:hypothetical protein
MDKRLLSKINDEHYYTNITRISKSMNLSKRRSSLDSILSKKLEKLKISQNSSEISSGGSSSNGFESTEVSFDRFPHLWRVKSYLINYDKIRKYDFTHYENFFTSYTSLEERLQLKY